MPEPLTDQQALISLIIPVYNVERYLAECLESAIHQSFPQLEIICVDDGSSDASLAILEEYAAKDRRIIVLRQEKNAGQSAARNLALRVAGAPYIMFLDSDDTYAPDMCEKMYRAICSSQADIAMCGIHLSYECHSEFKDGDEQYYRLEYEGTQEVTDELIGKCDVSPCNKIFRRELLDRYSISFPEGLKYEDAYFHNAYLTFARTINFVNEKLYHYRRRAGSTMSQTFRKEGSISADHLGIALKLHEFFSKWEVLEKRYPYFCRFFLNYVRHSQHHSPTLEDKEAVTCMAAEFARKHLTRTEGLDKACAEELARLQRIFPAHTSGTLLRIRTRPFSRHYRLLGIPVYEVRYSPRQEKHYILGLQVYRKKYSFVQ